MTPEQLRLRARIFDAIAETGAPRDVKDSPDLRALAAHHVVVLDECGGIVMAHPFAADRPGATRVEAAGRAWFGSCAWDGLGIAAALGLEDATVVDGGGVDVDAAAGFHVAVPARHWWDDIGFT